MNLILLMLLLGDSNASLCAIIFSAAHAFLSSLMFFLVDCVYRRFHSRSIYNISGLLHLTPNLGISIILMCVCFAFIIHFSQNKECPVYNYFAVCWDFF